MTAGISGVLLAITETSTWGWGSPKTLGLLAVGIAGDRRLGARGAALREPLVDMRMMAIRGVWTTNTVAFLIGVGMYSSFMLIPEFVQEPASTVGFGASATVPACSCCPRRSRSWSSGRWPGMLERRIGSRGALIGGAVFALAALRAARRRPQRRSGRSTSPPACSASASASHSRRWRT